MRLKIIDVRPGETEEQAEARTLAEKPCPYPGRGCDSCIEAVNCMADEPDGPLPVLAEKPEAPRMGWPEHADRLGNVVEAILGLPRHVDTPEEMRAELEALLCDYSITRDLLPLLRSPPQVCPECGKTFRGLVGGEWACLPCRDAAAEEKKIQREVAKRTGKAAQA